MKTFSYTELITFFYYNLVPSTSGLSGSSANGRKRRQPKQDSSSVIANATTNNESHLEHAAQFHEGEHVSIVEAENNNNQDVSPDNEANDGVPIVEVVDNDQNGTLDNGLRKLDLVPNLNGIPMMVLDNYESKSGLYYDKYLVFFSHFYFINLLQNIYLQILRQWYYLDLI